MIAKLIVLSLLAFSSSTAYAGYLMIGPHEFTPESPSTNYWVLADGLKTSAVGNVNAKVNIPVGRTVEAIWCQLYDASTAFNINVNLSEVYTDDSAGVGQRTMFFFNSAGNPGHKKFSKGTSELPTPVIRDIDNSGAGGTNRFYTYLLSVRLDGSSLTAVKTCAISYF